MHYIKWNTAEIKMLKHLYPKIRVKDLIRKFPNRNKKTIVAKALSIGLPSAKTWQLEEDRILKNCFAEATINELSKSLPKRTWKAIMARAERLGLKRKRDKPKLGVNENYFKYWTPNMAYILGFILADGCIIKGTYKGYSDSLKFGVQLSDKDILEKIKKEFKAEHKLSIVKNAVHFCIASQILVNDLKKLGISYRKSLNENLPAVPKQYAKDFIRGIVDGDGGIQIDRKRQPVIGVCGGEIVITFIRDYFLKNMQLYSKVGKRSYSEKQKNFLYEIRYKSSSALKVMSHLYHNRDCLYLDRKYKLAIRCSGIKIRERKNFDGRRHI